MADPRPSADYLAKALSNRGFAYTENDTQGRMGEPQTYFQVKIDLGWRGVG